MKKEVLKALLGAWILASLFPGVMYIVDGNLAV